jgi:hypothetical protein
MTISARDRSDTFLDAGRTRRKKGTVSFWIFLVSSNAWRLWDAGGTSRCHHSRRIGGRRAMRLTRARTRVWTSVRYLAQETIPGGGSATMRQLRCCRAHCPRCEVDIGHSSWYP